MCNKNMVYNYAIECIHGALRKYQTLVKISQQLKFSFNANEALIIAQEQNDAFISSKACAQPSASDRDREQSGGGEKRNIQ